jgi:spermidine synthase
MNVEEIAYSETPLGELTLRRRVEPLLQNLDVYEVKLGDEYLMSSLFTESEKQLAHLGLDGLEGDLDVVVGGLGLGYTAAAALEDRLVARLLVIDLFQPVIDWHQKGLVPLGRSLAGDVRCELRQGDFFELARTGFDACDRQRKFDAVLVDIDHSPKHFLDENNRSFYSREGLSAVREQIKAGGAFALWSNDPADNEFTKQLETVFYTAAAHDIEFPNPYTNATSVNSIYVATKR